MIIKFNRRKIETTSVFISFVFVLLTAILAGFAIADGLFRWDILPPNIEKIAILVMSVSGLIIGASFLISLMTNLSLISLNVERIADELQRKDQNGK